MITLERPYDRSRHKTTYHLMSVESTVDVMDSTLGVAEYHHSGFHHYPHQRYIPCANLSDEYCCFRSAVPFW